jgi:hypothetical protein
MVLESADRTATNYSGIFVNDGQYKGLFLTTVVSSITATPIITPTVQVRGPNEVWVTWIALAARSTAATSTTLIYPDWTVETDLAFTDEITGPIPYEFRIVFTHTDADSATYCVNYQFVM